MKMFTGGGLLGKGSPISDLSSFQNFFLFSPRSRSVLRCPGSCDVLWTVWKCFGCPSLFGLSTPPPARFETLNGNGLLGSAESLSASAQLQGGWPAVPGKGWNSQGPTGENSSSLFQVRARCSRDAWKSNWHHLLASCQATQCLLKDVLAGGGGILNGCLGAFEHKLFCH